MNRYRSIELPTIEINDSIQSTVPSLEWEHDSPSDDTFCIPSSPTKDFTFRPSDDADCCSSRDRINEKVTTIQEYTKLVMDCMKCGKRMTTTEVAKRIMGKVRPKPESLTVNIRRRVGDALSVLSGIDFVEKNKNGYIWKGNVDASQSLKALRKNFGACVMAQVRRRR